MINIGKDIYTILTGITGLTEVVDTNIYPLVIPENAVAPIVVIERNGVDDYNKDDYKSNVNVYLTLIAESFSEAMNIAQIINDDLDEYKGYVNNTRIHNCYFNNLITTYSQDAYMVKLSYSLTIS